MTNFARNKRIAIIVTSVLMVRFFLLPHIISLSKKYDLTLILKNDHPEILKAMNLSVRVVEIPIERKISLFKDFIATIFTFISIFGCILLKRKIFAVFFYLSFFYFTEI
jgi:hypothetical protein